MQKIWRFQKSPSKIWPNLKMFNKVWIILKKSAKSLKNGSIKHETAINVRHSQSAYYKTSITCKPIFTIQTSKRKVNVHDLFTRKLFLDFSTKATGRLIPWQFVSIYHSQRASNFSKYLICFRCACHFFLFLPFFIHFPYLLSPFTLCAALKLFWWIFEILASWFLILDAL